MLVLGLSLVTSLPGAAVAGDRDLVWIAMLGSVVGFVTLGVLGAERAWFIAADRREHFAWAEVRSIAGIVWGRYIGLFFCAALLAAVIFVPIILVAGLVQLALGGGDYGVALRVAIVVSGFVIEIALTFAMVVRVFSDISAADAIRHSLHVIRVEWPSSFWYAFAAPVTVQALVLALPPSSVSTGVRVATLTVDAIVRLFCVGAVALFWADRYMMIGIDS
jgi:hypothetical protein